MNLTPTNTHNHRLMRRQAFWGGAANGAWLIFAIPFLLRLEASITLISSYVALTSLGPLLIGPVAVALLRTRKLQRRWMLSAGITSRLFFFMPSLALLFGANRAEIAVGIFCICTLPTLIFSALWSPTPGIVIEPEHQPTIINARIRIANIGSIAANGAIGMGMVFVPFPYNYILVFSISGTLGLVEMYLISRIIFPESKEAFLESFKENFKLKQIWGEKQFIFFLFGIILITSVSSIAAPLQSVYFVQERGVSDRWIGIWAMAFSVGTVCGTLIWRKLQSRTGSYAIFSWTVPLAAIYLLLIVISPNTIWILVVTLLAGSLNAGTDIGIWLSLYRFGNDARRTMLINIYLGFILGIPFVTAFFIPFLTKSFSLAEILLASFVLRFLVGLYFKIPFLYRLLKDEPPLKASRQ